MTTLDLLGKVVIPTVLVCSTAPLMADPPPGGNWKPIPELTDEFDGKKLDSKKWHDHDPAFHLQHRVYQIVEENRGCRTKDKALKPTL